MLSNLNLQENNSIEAKTEIPKIGFRKNSSIEKAKENEDSSHFGNSLKIAFCQPTLCLLICAATFRHAGKNKNNLIGLLEIQRKLFNQRRKLQLIDTQTETTMIDR
jgi:hypothetical protein